MASKKASAVSPVSAAIASASAGEVSGPVATMTLSHSAGGRPAISPRAILDQRMVRERRGHGLREAVAVDGERASRRHLVGVGGTHHQRAEPPHLLVEQADGIVLAVIGAERVRADELGEAVGLVDRGRALGRISCSTTGTPREAICQAASLPARPPPMTWMGCIGTVDIGNSWGVNREARLRKPRRNP